MLEVQLAGASGLRCP